MRIYSDRLYLVELRRQHAALGWDAAETVLHLMRGDTVKARAYRHHARPYCAAHPPARTWRLEDGHLPDYQPTVSADAAAEIILAGGIASAVATD